MNDLEVGNNLQLVNGVGINEFSIDETLGDNSDSAVPTEKAVKTYVDANATASGLEVLDEGNGIGWRLKGRDPNNYGNIGFNAVDFNTNTQSSTIKGARGNYSVAIGFSVEANTANAIAMGTFTIASGPKSLAMGNLTTASGNTAMATGSNSVASGAVSTAMGSFTEASGDSSTALGSSSIASGNRSFAVGSSTQASGFTSTALGDRTISSGNRATAMGTKTIAPSYAETTIGSFNTNYTPNNTSNWDNDDRLFVIGNGENESNRNDAVIVYKNGNVEIDGNIEINGKLSINGELNETSTSDYNMIPLAYGRVSGTGTGIGTDNFTTNFSDSVYKISVTGAGLNAINAICLVTPSQQERIASVSFVSGDIWVKITGTNGNLASSSFFFLVYKL